MKKQQELAQWVTAFVIVGFLLWSAPSPRDATLRSGTFVMIELPILLAPRLQWSLWKAVLAGTVIAAFFIGVTILAWPKVT